MRLVTSGTQALPVTVVVTDNHNVYFCRSELDPTDYIIWVRTSDKDSSYMFLTHADLKLVRALHLRNNGFPDVMTAPPASSSIVRSSFFEVSSLIGDCSKLPPHVPVD